MSCPTCKGYFMSQANCSDAYHVTPSEDALRRAREVHGELRMQCFCIDCENTAVTAIARAIDSAVQAERDARPQSASSANVAAERCRVCGWTLAPAGVAGCSPDNCSYRPEFGSSEYYRIQERLKELWRRGIR